MEPKSGAGIAEKINLSAPWIDERDEELVLEVLRSGWLSLGPTGPRFEELLAGYVGAAHCAAVSSGTAGLHLCVRAAGVGPGDEVITSPYSFAASANCAIYEGATPVFAEIDPDTFNLDPAAVEAAVTERTKAVVAVDIFGYPCELDELRATCDRHGLALIEDACEALGAEYKGVRLGAHGHPAVFAFYPNKQMTTGEGGAIATGSADEHELYVSLRNQGRLETSSWLQHGRLGYNYRLGDLAAALGIGQLEKLDRILAARAEVAERYSALLEDVEVETPLRDDADHRRSWFVYVVKLPAGVDRDGIARTLAGRGVASAPYLPSIHLQPYMRERYGFSEGMLPVSEDCSARTLALPFHARLPAEDAERVVEELRAALAGA
ncbi:MAG TPA: DegT/DnrJ/EryC1/StrS family aminotransferase [Gaiellaceae bacterium]|jgi:perosamine synthetase|nr:DegT/DnrJ/EryC1/StrS family aminotransferase [Gaiellaceae bacterium]